MRAALKNSLKDQFVRWGVLLIVAIHQFGCGTIFFPERKGQPAGRLDLKVVALDAIGLLFFFVPGVIAFAVDFNNGTIYLPPESHVNSGRPGESWTRIRLSSTRPDSAEIEEAIRKQTGKVVRLKPGTYRARKLESAKSLEEINLDAHELAAACDAHYVRFRCQSE